MYAQRCAEHQFLTGCGARTSTKNPSKINPKSNQNAHMHTCFRHQRPQSTKKRSKIDPTRDPKEDAILTATWEALGLIFDGSGLQNEGVGGSWGSKNQGKSILGEVLGGLGGILGPKRHQAPFQERPGKIGNRFFERFWRGFGA